MSAIDPATKTDTLAEPFAPLAGWMAVSIVLLALAGFGPRLWASQASENASLALESVAVGQLLLAAIAWPIWTRSVTSAIGVIVSAPIWLLLAAQLAARPTRDALAMSWQLAGGLTVLSLIRVGTPSRAIAGVWMILVAAALGVPTLLYLRRDY